VSDETAHDVGDSMKSSGGWAVSDDRTFGKSVHALVKIYAQVHFLS